MNLPQGDFSEFDMEAIEPYLKKMNKEDIYLEIGVKHGKSLAFAREKSQGQIYGIDIEDNLDKEYFKNKKVTYFNHSSEEVAKKWHAPIDLLLIDGDHSFEAVEQDLRGFFKFIQPRGHIFFHDADLTSCGVIQAILYFLHQNNDWEMPVIYKKLLNKNTSMVSVRRIR